MSEIDQHWLIAFLLSYLVTSSLMWWRDSHDTKKEIDWLEDENHRLSEKHNDLVDMCKTLLCVCDTYKDSPSADRIRRRLDKSKKILKDIDEFVNEKH